MGGLYARLKEPEIDQDHDEAEEVGDDLDGDPDEAEVCIVEAFLVVVPEFQHGPSTYTHANTI